MEEYFTEKSEYAKIIKQIDEGRSKAVDEKTVEPAHNPPATFDGKPHQLITFRQFAGFANQINKDMVGDPFRLREMLYGTGLRNYDILYGGLKVGILWVRHEFDWADISIGIILLHPQLMPYHSVRPFLRSIAEKLCYDPDREKLGGGPAPGPRQPGFFSDLDSDLDEVRRKTFPIARPSERRHLEAASRRHRQPSPNWFPQAYQDG
jgi:hypothetical protein